MNTKNHLGECRDCGQTKELVPRFETNNVRQNKKKRLFCADCDAARQFFGINDPRAQKKNHLRYKVDPELLVITHVRCEQCETFKLPWLFKTKSKHSQLPLGVCDDCKAANRDASRKKKTLKARATRFERIASAREPLYPYEIRDGVAYVSITKRDGDVVTFMMDPEDLPKIYGRILNLIPRTSGSYYVAIKDYRYEGERNKYNTTYVHQAVMGKAPTGMDIDHQNRNPLDNRKVNLRIVTRQQNLHNSEHFESLQIACRNGHTRTTSNTVIYKLKNGKTVKHCLDCRKANRIKKTQTNNAQKEQVA